MSHPYTQNATRKQVYFVKNHGSFQISGPLTWRHSICLFAESKAGQMAESIDTIIQWIAYLCGREVLNRLDLDHMRDAIKCVSRLS